MSKTKTVVVNVYQHPETKWRMYCDEGNPKLVCRAISYGYKFVRHIHTTYWMYTFDIHRWINHMEMRQRLTNHEVLL